LTKPGTDAPVALCSGVARTGASRRSGSLTPVVIGSATPGLSIFVALHPRRGKLIRAVTLPSRQARVDPCAAPLTSLRRPRNRRGGGRHLPRLGGTTRRRL